MTNKLNKPLVSVCMVTCNHDTYIREPIEEVLMQKSSFSIELIIREDCISDITRAIVKEYEIRYPDII